MKFTAKVVPGIYWVGENDRVTPIFERMWPLPKGVAYNSYLIVDEKTCLVDTVCECADGGYIEAIEDLLADRELDYLIINHMEPDHTGDLPIVMARYPNATILGNKQTHKIYDAYFPASQRDKWKFQEVTDGETLSLGKKTLQFHITPWVHWPETMMTYELEGHVLFSGDVFGSFGTLDGGIFDDEMDATKYEDEMRRYYSNIVGKYSKMAQKALAKLAGVPVNAICATHGPIWRKDPSWVIGRYDKWSKQEGEEGVVVAVASMYGSTLDLGEYIARELARNGIRDIVFHDVSVTHVSYLISDIWKYRGLILGSVAYNTEMHPHMEGLCHELKSHAVGNKQLSIFGGCSWNGGGVRGLQKFAEDAKLPVVGTPLEMIGRPTAEHLEKASELAKELAAAVLASGKKK